MATPREGVGHLLSAFFVGVAQGPEITVQDVLLGLDLGTSSCKAGVVSLDGIELGHGREPTPWRTVDTGAELDPEELFRVSLRAGLQALEAVGPCRPIAVGIASQAEAGVLVDDRWRPLAPAMAWYDSRGAGEAQELSAALGAYRFASTTGLPLTSLCSLVKYHWLRRHLPTTAAGVRWFSLAEWMVWRLGGAPVAERSLASRTGFLALSSGAPWPDALKAVDAPSGLVGDLVWAGTACGRVSRANPRLRGAILTVAGMDHLASAVGVGCIRDQDVVDSCGTAEALVVSRPAPVRPDDLGASVAQGITVGWHVIPDRLAYLGALRSGAMLGRVLDLLGVPARDVKSVDAAGPREPNRYPDRWIVTCGDDPTQIRIVDDSDPDAVWDAAVEIVADLGMIALERLRTTANSGGSRVIGCGGWIRNRGFREAKIRRLGRSYRVTNVFEAGTRGAALLAGVAAGLYPSVHDVPPPIDLALADPGLDDGAHGSEA